MILHSTNLLPVAHLHNDNEWSLTGVYGDLVNITPDMCPHCCTSDSDTYTIMTTGVYSTLHHSANLPDPNDRESVAHTASCLMFHYMFSERPMNMKYTAIKVNTFHDLCVWS